MAKKLTKKQRENIEAEKAALSLRLWDMLVGAANGCSIQDDGDGDWFVMASIGLEQMTGWIRAAKNYLEFIRTDDWPQSWTDEELKERAFHYDNLQHFDTLNKAVEHLYNFGFRAE